MSHEPEIFISTDIEADGPIPGPYSMLSLGAAAFTAGKKILGKFSVNLKTLPGAGRDPRTMGWWQSQPDAWKACRADQVAPEKAMRDFSAWAISFTKTPVFIAYPASFDFMFVYWYLIRFTGNSPFSFVALDIKTFAWTLLESPFRKVRKSIMPAQWFDTSDKTHVAVEDAVEQGKMFCNMLRARTTVVPGGYDNL